MISIVTPTVRSRGLDLVDKALSRQTFKDFEWLPVGPHSVYLEHGFKRKFECKGKEFIEEPEKAEGDKWTLNKAYNKAIKEARGDLIVSWQDFTYAKPDTLEKLWFHYRQEPKTLVTAVGNKYTDETWSVQTWKDPRERDDQGTFYPCYWNDIEGNLCSVPKKAFYDVGGFDEEMDKWYGLDFFNVLNRLNDLGGYDFKIDQTIKSYSLEHGRLNEHWDRDNWMANGRYNDHVENQRRNGVWPVLPYLKTP